MARQIQSLVSTAYGSINTAVITLAGGGDGNPILVWVDEVAVTFGPAAAIGAASIDLDAAIVAALTVLGIQGDYTVSNDGAGVVTVVRDVDGAGIRHPLSVRAVSSNTMTVAVASQQHSWRMVADATAMNTGLPRQADDGFDIQQVTDEHKQAQGQGASLVFRARLSNGVLAPTVKTARWQLWAHSPVWGWSQVMSVGTRTITSTNAAGFTFDEVAVQLFGKDRVAPILLDDGAAGNLAGFDVHLDIWGSEG
jgi:hypothetical protein